MAAGRLDVLMGLDAAEFHRGLTKAEYEAQKFQRNLVRTFSQLGELAGLGFAAAATGAAALTKSAIDAADKLNDLSKATGVTVENLGGIGFAASQAGADLEGVASSFGKLNLKIAEAARGEKEASEAFKALGISVKDAAGQTRTADAIFKDIATAFERYADGPEKAALGNALFGKSYQSLLPLLADGGKALQENIDYYKQFAGTTTETAKAADAFNDTLGKIELVAGQLGRNLASELLPGLQAVADEFLRVGEQSNAFSGLAKAARVAFETIAILGANVVFVFEGIGREIGAVAAQMVALATLDLDAFNTISEAVKEDGKRARAELDALDQRIRNVAAGPSLAERIGTANPDRLLERQGRSPLTAPRLSGPSSAAKSVKAEVDENAQAYARYVEQLDSALNKSQEYTKVQEVTLAIEQNRFGQLIPQQKELLLLMAKQTDEATEYEAKIRHNAELERESMRALTERQAIIDRYSSSNKAREDAKTLEVLASEIGGSISIIDYDLAKSGFEGIKDEIKETTSAAEELGLVFTSAIGDFIKNPTDGKSFFKALTDDVLQLVTQLLILKPLAEGMTEIFGGTKASSSGGQQIAGIGAFFAEIFGSMVGSFAQGTDFVQADGLAMVHRGERIVTASDNRNGAGGTIVQNFQISAPDGSVSRATQAQIAASAGRALAQSRARGFA
jgi:hypothetical protein